MRLLRWMSMRHCSTAGGTGCAGCAKAVLAAEGAPATASPPRRVRPGQSSLGRPSEAALELSSSGGGRNAAGGGRISCARGRSHCRKGAARSTCARSEARSLSMPLKGTSDASPPSASSVPTALASCAWTRESSSTARKRAQQASQTRLTCDSCMAFGRPTWKSCTPRFRKWCSVSSIIFGVMRLVSLRLGSTQEHIAHVPLGSCGGFAAAAAAPKVRPLMSATPFSKRNSRGAVSRAHCSFSGWSTLCTLRSHCA
mmetsp:Transcript_26257/g.83114  ORF Transcript_26257/g.83114 Transcript_26257/m.83114 type:complete len:256 (-) Transcript_26257:736-1503(-)